MERIVVLILLYEMGMGRAPGSPAHPQQHQQHAPSGGAQLLETAPSGAVPQELRVRIRLVAHHEGPQPRVRPEQRHFWSGMGRLWVSADTPG